MGRKIRLVLMVLLLVVFCAAGSVVAFTFLRYEAEDKVYEQAAEEFIRRTDNCDRTGEDTGSVGEDSMGEGSTEEGNMAVSMSGSADRPPFEVDFEKLLEQNDDVMGWLYCEGTKINYPVVQGDDDEFYLSHNYKREYQKSGSIFIEVLNRPGFADSNTVIYGHQMDNQSMFGALSNWAEQDYYEEHPVMWLLTPETDYQVVLFTVGHLYGVYRAVRPAGRISAAVRAAVEF